MPSAAELRRGFEKRVENQLVVYVPKPGSKKLLIVFSFLDFTEYHRLRVLREDHRMNLLFLRDRSNDFYCSNGSDEVFRRVLRHFTRDFESHNITTYGVSMGGNGAIFHALDIGANAIAINPIIDWQASVELTDHAALKKRLREIGKRRFVHLPDLLRSRHVRSVVFCQFNRDDMGIENAKALSAVTPDYGTLVYEISNVPLHVAVHEVLSPKGIYDRIALTAQLRRIRVPLFIYDVKNNAVSVTKARL